jgi:hypothetical protein
VIFSVPVTVRHQRGDGHVDQHRHPSADRAFQASSPRGNNSTLIVEISSSARGAQRPK